MSEEGTCMDIERDHSSTITTTNEGIPVQKSIQDYVLIVSNIHEEATEEDLIDFLQEYGNVKGVHLNLDRETGYAKGYAFAEYETLEEAQRAKDEGSGEEFLGHFLSIDFAFSQGDVLQGLGTTKQRARSRSPERE